MKLNFRKAIESDQSKIWAILQQAIENRKKDGSNQWQDGYPNPNVIAKDIQKGIGFVMLGKNNIIGYLTLAINDEPSYDKIKGKWITHQDYVVFHRMAISNNYLGKGLAKKMFDFIEEFALKNKIYSIKADTNFDNHAMLKLFEKYGYQYCGEVFFRESPRKAFEKVLVQF